MINGTVFFHRKNAKLPQQIIDQFLRARQQMEIVMLKTIGLRILA